MTTVKDIYNYIDQIAPFENALSFDNCGILVGNPEQKVSKVLLALDITTNVAEEAASKGANLIISHHPIIFRAIKSINFEGTTSYLIKNQISAICAHTNLDVAKEGVNFHLSQKLSLYNLQPLTYEEDNPMGLIGELGKEMPCIDFANHVKNSLNCKGLRYTNTNKIIKKVAVCSGSGGVFVEDAIKQSADAFVTGEIKHSDILKANQAGLMIVDAGHYKTENVIIKPLCEKLKQKFTDTDFFVSTTFSDEINYL